MLATYLAQQIAAKMENKIYEWKIAIKVTIILSPSSPWDAKDGVDHDAHCHHEEVKMVTSSFFQKILLPVNDHSRDLLVLEEEMFL